MTTGFTKGGKAVILARDTQCQFPDCRSEADTVHHRAGRGMGGAPSANRLSNAVGLCSWHNVKIEIDPHAASVARFRGLIISRYVDPRKVPVMHRTLGPIHLMDDGGYMPAAQPRPKGR